ncbi:hypothetical protein [Deinococcus maricopensis]|uniref:Uncharacterized protein n=1 Tax=Deinococcus maricopensis (strain DSM 21211 / LMG 22137 / NRRL B-23946 / LB-34) TaxID=709986 RepID=E8U8K3_DEIML|nr:hypothetical protein [Deinococcus maricopensis]ADV67392.1 hypothetical protein Deima_1743 [Deinococcus maricopensis DSM 21211]
MAFFSAPDTLHTWTDAQLLGALDQDGADAECVRRFAALLLVEARAAGVQDVEGAVVAALRDIRALCHGCERSGLPVRAWVLGVARRRYRLLRT